LTISSAEQQRKDRTHSNCRQGYHDLITGCIDDFERAEKQMQASEDIEQVKEGNPADL
jgi:hypothetical protein